jgi:hypothetical protein
MERASVQRKDRDRARISHAGRPYRLLIGELAYRCCFLSGHCFPIAPGSLAAEQQHLHSRHLQAFRTRPKPLFPTHATEIGQQSSGFLKAVRAPACHSPSQWAIAPNRKVTCLGLLSISSWQPGPNHEPRSTVMTRKRHPIGLGTARNLIVSSILCNVQQGRNHS